MLPENLIREFILPEYLNSGVKPSPEQNRLHVRYLRHFLSKTSTALNNLKEEIGKIQILLVSLFLSNEGMISLLALGCVKVEITCH